MGQAAKVGALSKPENLNNLFLNLLKMIAAVVRLKKSTPVSYNAADAKNKRKYKDTIVAAFEKNYNGKIPKFKKGTELYGQVCFFTSDGTNLDADNISKPVWDALVGIIYDDDKQIVSRTSTVVYTKKHNLISIDGSSDTAAELLQVLTGKYVQCIYVECGHFNDNMIEIEKEERYEY